jgi:cobalt-zinc-cadmium efflux system membrane fusion protein
VFQLFSRVIAMPGVGATRANGRPRMLFVRSWKRAWPLALLSLGCSSGSAEATTEPPPPQVVVAEDGTIQLAPAAREFVHVEPVTLGHDVAVLRAPAHVAYRDGTVAEVGAPVEGRITEVLARVGDTVEAGAPLIVLRSPDAAAARAALAADQAALENALAEAQRTADMLSHGIATERERRAADLAVSELQIELTRGRTQVSIVGRGSGGEVTIRAPITGTIISRRASIGMMVGGADEEALVEIGDPTALGVTVDVFDRDAAMIVVGAAVEVSVPSIEEPLHGHVTHIAPVVTSGMRTVPVRVDLDGMPASLRPGLFGRATITLVDAGIVVPASAILVRDGDQTVVYLETAEGEYDRRAVTVGMSVDGRVYVENGLSVGERVVIGGALLLDGAADQLL